MATLLWAEAPAYDTLRCPTDSGHREFVEVSGVRGDGLGGNAVPGVTCSRCGLTWPRDPALEVACPECYAKPGRICRRPSGHRLFGGGVHGKRDALAVALGVLGKCPGNVEPPGKE